MSRTNYEVGKQTRKKILEVSRNLFYDKGLKDTTYDDISREAKINRALIPYYFHTKYWLGREVFRNVTAEFFQALDKKISISSYSSRMKNNIHTIGYYRLLINHQYGRFAAQIFNSEGLVNEMTLAEQKFIRQYFCSEKTLTDQEVKFLARLDYGMEREIINMIHDGLRTEEVDQICIMEMKMILQYCGYSVKEIEKQIAETIGILDQFYFEVKPGFEVNVSRAS